MRRLALALALAFVLLLAACGEGDPAAEPVDGGSPLPLPTQEPSDSADEMLAEIRGVVEFEEDTGCVVIVVEDYRYPVIWPTGTAAQRDPFRLVLPDGTVAREGDTVSGAGGYPTADEGPDPVKMGVPAECLEGPGRTRWKEAAAFNPNGAVEVETS
jgi:hypothetical protein